MSKKEVSVACSGAGFLGAYYAGVILCLKRNAPGLKIVKAAGASAGSVAACCLLSKKPIEEMIGPVLLFCSRIRRYTLSSFSACCDWDAQLRETIEALLTDDILDDVNGKLHVSITRVTDRKNILINQFESRNDLIDCLRASCFVPIFSGMLPVKFRGEHFIDGSFSDNLPRIFDPTITVSPFIGDIDISPEPSTPPARFFTAANTTFALCRENLRILWHCVWPQRIDRLKSFGELGYARTMAYLIRTGQITCGNCERPPCEQCRIVQNDLDPNRFPEDIAAVVEKAIQQDREAARNEFIRQTINNVVSIALLPFLFPVQCLFGCLLLLIPHITTLYLSIKDHVLTNNLITLLTILIVLPIEISWLVTVFTMKYAYNSLRNVEEVVLPEMKSKISTTSRQRVISKLHAILLMCLVIPMDLINIVFFLTPYSIAKYFILWRISRASSGKKTDEKHSFCHDNLEGRPLRDELK